MEVVLAPSPAGAAAAAEGGSDAEPEGPNDSEVVVPGIGTADVLLVGVPGGRSQPDPLPPPPRASLPPGASAFAEAALEAARQWRVWPYPPPDDPRATPGPGAYDVHVAIGEAGPLSAVTRRAAKLRAKDEEEAWARAGFRGGATEGQLRGKWEDVARLPRSPHPLMLSRNPEAELLSIRTIGLYSHFYRHPGPFTPGPGAHDTNSSSLTAGPHSALTRRVAVLRAADDGAAWARAGFTGGATVGQLRVKWEDTSRVPRSPLVRFKSADRWPGQEMNRASSSTTARPTSTPAAAGPSVSEARRLDAEARERGRGLIAREGDGETFMYVGARHAQAAARAKARPMFFVC